MRPGGVPARLGIGRRAAACRIFADGLSWRVDDGRDFVVDVDVSTADATGDIADVVGGTCLAATIGLSADHHGRFEAARMRPDRRAARAVVVERVEPRFIDGFRSARPAPSYLMEDIDVTWTAAPAAAPHGRTVERVAALTTSTP